MPSQLELNVSVAGRVPMWPSPLKITTMFCSGLTCSNSRSIVFDEAEWKPWKRGSRYEPAGNTLRRTTSPSTA